MYGPITFIFVSVPVSFASLNSSRIFRGAVIANIGGFSIDEYAENCEKLNSVEQVGIIEVNISCPNVHEGGKNFGTDPKSAAVVRSRQLHIYRNGKKILILAGKAQPKIIREDKLNELIKKII